MQFHGRTRPSERVQASDDVCSWAVLGHNGSAVGQDAGYANLLNMPAFDLHGSMIPVLTLPASDGVISSAVSDDSGFADGTY